MAVAGGGSGLLDPVASAAPAGDSIYTARRRREDCHVASASGSENWVLGIFRFFCVFLIPNNRTAVMK